MDYIDLCINYLEKGKCILFLGPRFAINNQGEFLHKGLKKHLEENGFKEKLDYSFDNLFIFNDSKPNSLEKMRLNIALKNFYEKQIPHKIYSMIPFLPFQAIVSCSPDLFLKKSFEENNLLFNFQYFSHKGTSDYIADGDLPIIYNVFGNIEKEDSLITSHESFFKSMISIMGDEQKIPIDLKNSIAHSNVFIFCGFDLTKWYIPMLIHKLNSYRKKDDDDISAAIINKENFKNLKTNRLYPIELLLSEAESLKMLGKLYELTKNKGLLKKPKSIRETTKSREIKNLLADNNINFAIDSIILIYEQKEINSSELILIKSRYNRLKSAQRTGTISSDNSNLEMNQIMSTLIDLVDKIEY